MVSGGLKLLFKELLTLIILVIKNFSPVSLEFFHKDFDLNSPPTSSAAVITHFIATYQR